MRRARPRGRRCGRRWGALAVVLLVLPLGACQATVRVVANVKASGSGELAVVLVLDRDAATAVGDVGAALRVTDLEHGGWIMDPVAKAADGSVTATVHHPFHDPAEANALLASLGGRSATPPVNLKLSHLRGRLHSSVAIAGTVDMRAGVDAFADDKLRQALGVPSLAAALAQLQQQGAATPVLRAEVVARLPGHPQHVSPTGRVQGDNVVWTLALGDQRAIAASAAATDTTAEAWLAGAAACLIAFVLVVVARVRRRGGDTWSVSTRGRRRRSRGSSRGSSGGRGPGNSGRSRGHQDRWSLPTGPGSRR